jgi:hypothetical protein
VPCDFEQGRRITVQRHITLVDDSLIRKFMPKISARRDIRFKPSRLGWMTVFGVVEKTEKVIALFANRE